MEQQVVAQISKMTNSIKGPQTENTSSAIDRKEMFSLDTGYLLLAEAAEAASKAEEITRRYAAKCNLDQTSKPENDETTISSRPKYVYHDYSSVPDTIGYVRKKTGGVTQPFPEKLMEMLTREEGTMISPVVSWLCHGRAFIVLKPKEFTKTIMPKYFKQTKLTSFQRQLNLYGFRRITQGPDSGAYFHEMFLRGKPQLCMKMYRQKVKGTGHKQPTDVQSEPNFYALIFMPSPMKTDKMMTTEVEPMQTVCFLPSPVNSQKNPQVVPVCISPTNTLHNAANLLQGIANRVVTGSTPFSLGATPSQSYNPKEISLSTNDNDKSNQRYDSYSLQKRIIGDPTTVPQDSNLSSQPQQQQYMSGLDILKNSAMLMPSLPSLTQFQETIVSPSSTPRSTTVPQQQTNHDDKRNATFLRNELTRKVTMDFFSHDEKNRLHAHGGSSVRTAQ